MCACVCVCNGTTIYQIGILPLFVNLPIEISIATKWMSPLIYSLYIHNKSVITILITSCVGKSFFNDILIGWIWKLTIVNTNLHYYQKKKIMEKVSDHSNLCTFRYTHSIWKILSLTQWLHNQRDSDAHCSNEYISWTDYSFHNERWLRP